MKIYWKSEQLKKKVEKMAKSNRRINKRMIQIVAADNFVDLIPASRGRAHFLKGGLKDCFAIDVCCKENSMRYICSPAGDCEKNHIGYKKETIKELIIEKIEKDYH